MSGEILQAILVSTIQMIPVAATVASQWKSSSKKGKKSNRRKK